MLHRRSVRTRLLLAVATAAAVVVPAAAADASPTERDAALAQMVWDDVNHARASRGLDRLVAHRDLVEGAQRVSDRNASTGTMRHGSDYGWSLPMPAGVERARENVAMHQDPAAARATVDAWLGSDGHRAAMLSADGAVGGAGVATRDGRRMVTLQVGDGAREQVRFSDVGTHAGSIHRLADAGITGGCGGDRYCPGSGLTRGQMATFLARATALRPIETDAFTDVRRGTPHGHNIGAIAESGVTAGCSADRFCPNREVTRGQLASFLTRALELPAGDATGFGDVPRDHPHAAGIGALSRSGITEGCGAEAFCPDHTVTRGQAAAFLDRAGLS